MEIELSEGIKAAIMLEVHSQLNPLKVEVQSLGKTVRSLYSNGTGGPPGYLETARAEDQEWKTELKDVVKEHGDQLTVIAGFVEKHNRRDVENEERQKKREERWEFWKPRLWTLAAGLGSSAVTGLVWGCHKLLPVALAAANRYAQGK